MQVLGARAIGARQAHLYVVILVVGPFPVADRLAGEQRPQRGGQLGDADAQVARQFALELDRELRLGRLVARFGVDRARYFTDRCDHLVGEFDEHLAFLAEDRNLDRLAAGNGLEGADLLQLDAGNAREALPHRLGELALRALALFPWHKLDEDVDLVLSLHEAGIDGGVGDLDLRELAQCGLGLLGLGLGQRERGAHRRLELHLQFGQVGLGDEFGADEFDHSAARDESRDGQCDDRLSMAEGPAEQALVAYGYPLHEAVEPGHGPADRPGTKMSLGLWVVPDRRQHRVQRERHEHRDQYCGHHCQAELVEEAADDAAHEAHRQEHRDDGQRCCEHREADFLRAFERRRVMVGAQRHVAHDVFAHHDGVVDQQAHRQR